MHMGYPAFVLESETHPAEENWITLPNELRLELDQFVASYPARPDGQLDGPCFWFDQRTRRCKHHEYRPRVCRDFAVGSTDCLAWREWLADRTDEPDTGQITQRGASNS